MQSLVTGFWNKIVFDVERLRWFPYQNFLPPLQRGELRISSSALGFKWKYLKTKVNEKTTYEWL